MNILLSLICIVGTCSAFNIDHVTFDEDPVPGSIRIEYTGIAKLVLSESVDFLQDEWVRTTFDQFEADNITYYQYRQSLLRLAQLSSEYKMRGQWWTRDWWHSLSPDKGGVHRPITYVVGRQGDIIDFGIAKVNQNFKFEFKEWEADLNSEWKFRFKPRMNANTKDLITRAVCVFVFEYYIKSIKTFRISIEIGYRKRLKEFVEFRIEMFTL